MRNLIIAALALALTLTAKAQEDGYHIFISADMEGLVGAVTGVQVSSSEREYAAWREIMTNEILAAMEGAKAAGATRFTLADSHGSMQNIIIQNLPKDVRIVRGRPRENVMMEGIQDGEYDGVIFLGYHASASHMNGVMSHTISGAYSEVLINGEAATEGMMNAAVAGEFGVPVIMVAGDQAAVEEVADAVGNGMERAIVKHAYGSGAAMTMTPAAAYDLIRERAEAAVSRIEEIPVFTVEGPITLDLRFRSPRRAELLGWSGLVERTSVDSIRHQTETMAEMARFLGFLVFYPG